MADLRMFHSKLKEQHHDHRNNSEEVKMDNLIDILAFLALRALLITFTTLPVVIATVLKGGIVIVVVPVFE